tara:strand:+ start:5681 stop:6121 length:441 start_codon:yes stop_codon:yes gene_type:complete
MLRFKFVHGHVLTARDYMFEGESGLTGVKELATSLRDSNPHLWQQLAEQYAGCLALPVDCDTIESTSTRIAEAAQVLHVGLVCPMMALANAGLLPGTCCGEYVAPETKSIVQKALFISRVGALFDTFAEHLKDIHTATTLRFPAGV